MNLLETYKAKKLGRSQVSLLASVLGNKSNVSYEWITEKVPYISRNTANGMDVTSLCKDKIVGGTVAWNQACSKLGRVRSTLSSNINGTSDIVCTSTGGNSSFGVVPKGQSADYKYIENHIYLVSINITDISVNDFKRFSCETSLGSVSPYFTTVGRFESICKPTSTSAKSVFCNVKTTGGSTTSDNFTFNSMQVFDLTQMFGSTIADYIYSLEQSTAGAGVAWFKALFGEEWYPFKETDLMSVNVLAHVNRDAAENIIGNYSLDETLSLRGIPKLDANNKLYYDGDTYESDGTVTRKYGIRAYQSGDATDGATMITDGTNTIYKLDTPITEDADAFSSVQVIDPSGTEEYVVAEQSGVALPVGHETKYRVLAE